MHEKSAYVTASSDPGLRRIRCCTVLHRSEVMISLSNASRIVVYLLVKSARRHIGLHKGVPIRNTSLHVCGFACTLYLEQLRPTQMAY